MSKVNEKLSEVLDIEPIDYSENEIVNTVSPVEDDAEFARQNIRGLIEKGNVAMDNILNVAKESEHPRAYEVAANMLKSLADMNKDLMEIQKRKKDLQPKSEQNNVNVQNAVFVGSTKDLVKMLKNKE